MFHSDMTLTVKHNSVVINPPRRKDVNCNTVLRYPFEIEQQSMASIIPGPTLEKSFIV